MKPPRSRIVKSVSALALVFSLFFFGGMGALPVQAQFSENLHVGGYIQGMPLRISVDLPEPFGSETWMEYRLQNRLNLRWEAGESTTFHWQMRTRLFAGDLVQDIPGYAAGIDTDDGLVNLSRMIIEQETWLLHYIPDRLYVEWDRADWNIRVGRQRVNWGVNMITNPNDIFNIYSFYDFDYPERPGSDAVRIQRFLGFGSRLELAVSPARDIEQSVAAALYAFHTRGYDIQLITGYYRERLTAGAGWAGNIRGAGFKGETMVYTDLKAQQNGDRSTNLITSASIDYMFPNSLFLVSELLYNKDGGRDQFQLFTVDLSPDNPSFSTWQFTSQASYPIHPLVDGSFAVIWYPDEQAAFFSPSVNWSVITDLDFQILGQFFAAGSRSAFTNAGNLIVASLKYNF